MQLCKDRDVSARMGMDRDLSMEEGRVVGMGGTDMDIADGIIVDLIHLAVGKSTSSPFLAIQI